MILLDTLQLPLAPWKNGGGYTREVFCWPPGATTDNFAWRISIAEVGQSGPFSIFPGIDRMITLLDGDGMWLVSPGRYRHALTTPYRPFSFLGEEELAAELAGSVSHDLNLMLRRELVAGGLETITGARDLGAAQQSLVLFAAQGQWQIENDDKLRHHLQSGQAGIFTGSHGALKLNPIVSGSVLLCARIRLRQDRP